MPSEWNIISDVFDHKIKFSDSHLSLKLHEHFITRINEIVHFTDSKMSISMLLLASLLLFFQMGKDEKYLHTKLAMVITCAMIIFAILIILYTGMVTSFQFRQLKDYCLDKTKCDDVMHSLIDLRYKSSMIYIFHMLFIYILIGASMMHSFYVIK
jgi:ABC-type proline/glycine betaine transport system permease subunit